MRWYDSNKEDLLTFDDVLLIPKYSELNSRLDVNTDINWRKRKLSPIIVANMSSVATLDMANALAPLKIITPFHRFQSIEDEINCLSQADDCFVPKAGTIGLHDRERTEKIADISEWLFLELAHADTKHCIEEIKWIKQNWSKKTLVVGNVATRDACKRLFDTGCDIVKVGVGCGSVCLTRIICGTGFPQLTAIAECAKEGPIIGDGGLKNSGDICKALAAGAMLVMAGSLFAGTDESKGSGRTRYYSGMASKQVRADSGKRSTDFVPEGISTEVPYKGSAINIAEDLLAGLRQGMSMIGAKNIKELQEKAEFVKISSNTVIENQPHILFRK